MKFLPDSKDAEQHQEDDDGDRNTE